MTLTHRLLFHVLRFVDDLFPGWQERREPPADYLTHESFTFWMGRVIRDEARR